MLGLTPLGALRRATEEMRSIARLARPLSYKGRRLDLVQPDEAAPPPDAEFLGSTKGTTIIPPRRSQRPKVFKRDHEEWWKRAIHRQRAREGVSRYQDRHPALPFNPRELPPSPWAVSHPASIGIGRGRRTYAVAAGSQAFRRPRRLSANRDWDADEDDEDEEDEERIDTPTARRSARIQPKRSPERPAARAKKSAFRGRGRVRDLREEEEDEDEDEDNENTYDGLAIRDARVSSWQEERDEEFDEELWQHVKARQMGLPAKEMPGTSRLRGAERKALKTIAPGPPSGKVEAAVRARDAERFSALIKGVEVEDAVPAVFVCNAAMHALAEAGEPAAVDALLDLMLQERVFPDSVTLAVYVRGSEAAAPAEALPGDHVLRPDGPHARVAAVFERFRRLAARPTIEAVTAVVQRYAAAGRPGAEILALFRALRARYNIACDPPAYTALIKAVCFPPRRPAPAQGASGAKAKAEKAVGAVGGPLLAMALLREMNRQKGAADALLYTTVVSALCKRGAVGAATAAFEEGLSFGCRFDTLAWNVVMFGLCVRGRTPDAENWLSRMHAEGADPDAFTYACLARSYAKEGRREEGRRVLELAAREGVMPAGVSLEWVESYAGFGEIREISARQAAQARPRHGSRPWLNDPRRDPLEQQTAAPKPAAARTRDLPSPRRGRSRTTSPRRGSRPAARARGSSTSARALLK
eukprot:tig00000383_g24711.t1